MGNWLKMGQLAFAMIFLRVLRLFVQHCKAGDEPYTKSLVLEIL